VVGLVGWLAGSLVIICCWGFWASFDSVYEYLCCYNHFHGNALNGFWALWAIFTLCVLLQPLPW
jgi:hypothetical protein